MLEEQLLSESKHHKEARKHMEHIDKQHARDMALQILEGNKPEPRMTPRLVVKVFAPLLQEPAHFHLVRVVEKGWRAREYRSVGIMR